jgi:16S rRNA (adenine1518-N6/adenine1519-N6)-dimethyltransferase
LLAISVQIYGVPEIVGHIPSRAFYPQPKVDSSIIRINLPKSSIVPPELISAVFRLAKIGFNQKRKQLRNSLSAGMGVEKELVEKWLRESGIDPRSRPQELALEKWIPLAEAVSDYVEDSQQK